MASMHIIGTFPETSDFQSKYDTVLSACEKEGTMVSQDRLIEKDMDIAPHRFFRKGTREYIFPQQEVTLKEDKSETVYPQKDHPSPSETAGYGIISEIQTYSYNETAVKGRIRIEYKDSHNEPALRVIDVLENSELPSQLIETLDDIFGSN